MWHKHHENESEERVIKNWSISDLNIAPEDSEKWRQFLKQEGFEPLEIERVLEKSEAFHRRQDINDRNFEIMTALLEQRLGRNLSDQDRNNLHNLLPT